MSYWLLKSEPSCFSIEDLAKRKAQTELWDGVRNYQARNFMRQMKIGDLAFFYHSNTQIPAVVGVVKIVREAYPDPTQFNVADPHFDPKSHPANPRWSCVDVQLVEILKNPISLAAMKNNEALSDFALVQKGCRLSVMPVSQTQWQTILSMQGASGG